jgi:hypothetical protein
MHADQAFGDRDGVRSQPDTEVVARADSAPTLGRIDPVHGARGYLARAAQLR